MTEPDNDFIPDPPGQSGAEFFAGLALLGMGRDQFCALTGLQRQTIQKWWKGDSFPSRSAMVVLRLMAAGKITWAQAMEINGPDGLDLWDEALDRIGPDRLARALPPDLRQEVPRKSEA